MASVILSAAKDPLNPRDTASSRGILRFAQDDTGLLPAATASPFPRDASILTPVGSFPYNPADMQWNEPLDVPPEPLKKRPLAVATFFLLAVLVLWATGKILAPYITPILLGVIIATFTFPVYRRLRTRMKDRHQLAAGLMLLGVTLTIILPAFILMMLLVQQATTVFELVQKTDFQAIVKQLRIDERLALVERYVPGFDSSVVQPDQLVARAVQTIPGLVASHGATALASFANIILGFLMMLLAAYYFYTEGEKIVQELVYLSPLPDEYDEEIIQRFRGVVDATFRGQILTALAQGAVTGIGLAIAGVPAPVLWGAVAALFSLIPMVGAAAVWVPATIYLFIAASFGNTSYGYAIFLLVWGLLVVSVVDNLIRPWAMKSGTNMNAIVLFFSILGGISAFGFVGILLGPLVFALLVTVAHIYKNFFRVTLVNQNEDLIPAREAVDLSPMEIAAREAADPSPAE